MKQAFQYFLESGKKFLEGGEIPISYNNSKRQLKTVHNASKVKARKSISKNTDTESSAPGKVASSARPPPQSNSIDVKPSLPISTAVTVSSSQIAAVPEGTVESTGNILPTGVDPCEKLPNAIKVHLSEELSDNRNHISSVQSHETEGLVFHSETEHSFGSSFPSCDGERARQSMQLINEAIKKPDEHRTEQASVLCDYEKMTNRLPQEEVALVNQNTMPEAQRQSRGLSHVSSLSTPRVRLMARVAVLHEEYDTSNVSSPKISSGAGSPKSYNGGTNSLGKSERRSSMTPGNGPSNLRQTNQISRQTNSQEEEESEVQFNTNTDASSIVFEESDQALSEECMERVGASGSPRSLSSPRKKKSHLSFDQPNVLTPHSRPRNSSYVRNAVGAIFQTPPADTAHTHQSSVRLTDDDSCAKVERGPFPHHYVKIEPQENIPGSTNQPSTARSPVGVRRYRRATTGIITCRDTMAYEKLIRTSNDSIRIWSPKNEQRYSTPNQTVRNELPLYTKRMVSAPALTCLTHEASMVGILKHHTENQQIRSPSFNNKPSWSLRNATLRGKSSPLHRIPSRTQLVAPGPNFTSEANEASRPEPPIVQSIRSDSSEGRHVMQWARMCIGLPRTTRSFHVSNVTKIISNEQRALQQQVRTQLYHSGNPSSVPCFFAVFPHQRNNMIRAVVAAEAPEAQRDSRSESLETLMLRCIKDGVPLPKYAIHYLTLSSISRGKVLHSARHKVFLCEGYLGKSTVCDSLTEVQAMLKDSNSLLYDSIYIRELDGFVMLNSYQSIIAYTATLNTGVEDRTGEAPIKHASSAILGNARTNTYTASARQSQNPFDSQRRRTLDSGLGVQTQSTPRACAFCPEHPKEPLELLCEQDRRVICYTCARIGRHRTHSTVSLVPLVSEQFLTSQIAHTSQRIATMDAAAIREEEVRMHHRRQIEHLRKLVVEQFDAQVTLLQQRRDKLLTMMDEKMIQVVEKEGQTTENKAWELSFELTRLLACRSRMEEYRTWSLSPHAIDLAILYYGLFEGEFEQPPPTFSCGRWHPTIEDTVDIKKKLRRHSCHESRPHVGKRSSNHTDPELRSADATVPKQPIEKTGQSGIGSIPYGTKSISPVSKRSAIKHGASVKHLLTSARPHLELRPRSEARVENDAISLNSTDLSEITSSSDKSTGTDIGASKELEQGSLPEAGTRTAREKDRVSERRLAHRKSHPLTTAKEKRIQPSHFLTYQTREFVQDVSDDLNDSQPLSTFLFNTPLRDLLMEGHTIAWTLRLKKKPGTEICVGVAVGAELSHWIERGMHDITHLWPTSRNSPSTLVLRVTPQGTRARIQIEDNKGKVLDNLWIPPWNLCRPAYPQVTFSAPALEGAVAMLVEPHIVSTFPF